MKYDRHNLTKEGFKEVVAEADRFILNNLPKDNKFYVGKAVRRLMANFALYFHENKKHES